jgi:molybdopterin-guanine dinucleotide biosynthesis protein MobB
MARADSGEFGCVRVVGFYGPSNSGKTTLIERVLGDLQAHGLRAAVIKQSRWQGQVDTPGTDTWRFNQAGAGAVVFQSGAETVFFLRGQPSLDELVAWVVRTHSPNIILVEGASDARVPKVRLGDIEQRPNTVMDYSGDFAALMELILEGVQT